MALALSTFGCVESTEVFLTSRSARELFAEMIAASMTPIAAINATTMGTIDEFFGDDELTTAPPPV